jgi:cephalosporin hydroxylase
LRLLNYKHMHLEEIINSKVRMILDSMQESIVNNTSYFGIKTQKNSLDFWLYQEIIVNLQPDYIIEIGNYYGGSTLALAHICDNLNKCNVLGIEIDHSKIDKQEINQWNPKGYLRRIT